MFTGAIGIERESLGREGYLIRNQQVIGSNPIVGSNLSLIGSMVYRWRGSSRGRVVGTT